MAWHRRSKHPALLRKGLTDSGPKPPRKKADRREQVFQIKSVVPYLAAVLDPDLTIFLHVPNGGARSPVEAAIFKAMGVRAGWPDITVLALSGVRYAGVTLLGACLIELKRDDGKGDLTDSQRELYPEIERRLRKKVHVCESLEQVRSALEADDIPMRPHTLWPTGGYVLGEVVNYSAASRR
jgi:hypothetical protein